MASATAAPRPPAPPPPPPPPPAAAAQWLGPRVSFSLDDAGGGGGVGGREAAAAAGGKAGPGAGAGADFEFLLGGCAAACSMLPADELFSGGKLVPLRIPASTDETAAGAEAEVAAQSTLLPPPPKQEQQQQPETPRAAAEPKVPARRWRDLLRLRKQQASPGAAADPRPLRRLLRRGPKPPEPEPSLSLPLLREPGPEEPNVTTKATEKTASSQHQSLLPPKIRLSAPQQQTSAPPPAPPPPPPSAVAADSPRLNAAGKVVFNGLGRSSSSPSSLAGGRRHRSGSAGAMERSYSAHVRVAPVLNVPVCSLRGSRKSAAALGIDRLFAPSSSGAASSSAGAAKKNRAAKKDVGPGAQ